MTLDELKTLLALNGKQRIPYAEEEIFDNKDLYTCYLDEICKNTYWINQLTSTESGSLSAIAYLYAKLEIGSRWMEAEPVIATSNRYIASRYNDTFGTNI
jgi:hypothetical protein